MKKPIIIALLISSVAFSCKKESTSEQKMYVSKMVYDNAETSFSLDEKNRIVSINDASNLIIDYTYTGDNISKIRYDYPSEGEIVVYDVSYDGGTPKSATKKFSSTHGGNYIHTYIYNISSNKVSSIDIFDDLGQKIDSEKFTYIGNNITKIESNVESYEYALGTSKSAFSNSLRKVPLIEDEPAFLFNSLVITNEIYTSGSFVDQTSYQYTYDGDYPLSAIMVNKFGNQSETSTLKYSYVKK